MKAFSGILRVKGDSHGGGRAVIDFDDFPSEGSSVGDATIHQTRQVGGRGKFNHNPAYMAHLREYHLEDKGRGNSEIDEWTINSAADENRIRIDWKTDEGRSKVLEVGFLAVGE